MKVFGKEFKFNNNKVYHAGDKPVAADIKFTDGKTFQQKLDDGSLRGPQGPQGVKGDTGAKGATGNTGPQGPQGIQGIQGPKGDTGAKGATGSTGAKGVSMRLKGAWSSTTAYVNDSNYIDLVTSGGNTYACKASNTNQAVTNTTYWELIAQKGNTGATGPQGPQGTTGAKGATGATGPAGATPTIKAGTVTTGAAGTNAVVTASTSGTTTTFNFTIPRGANGATGGIGPQGPKGDQGLQGPKGADGLTTSVTVNGTKYTHVSGNITLPNYPTLSSLGAAANSHNHDSVYAKTSHSHSYVPLSGGTMTGSIYMANDKYFLGTNTTGGTHSILGITTSNNVVVGTTSQNLVLRANENPRVLVGSSYYNLYHSGNKPTAGDVGALALSGGALTGNVSIDTSRYFQYKLTKGAITTETGTLAQNTAVNMLGYSDSNNLHLGNGIWDNSITQGTTYVSGAAGLTLRTINGPINFVSDKTNVGYVTTYGVVLGTNEAISSVSTGYKAYDIYRKCNSSLSGYSHTNARFGLVDADSGVAALETKLYNTSGATIKTAYLRLDANAGRAYTDGYFQSGQKWIKLGSRWLTIDTAAPSGAKGDIWIQCY